MKVYTELSGCRAAAPSRGWLRHSSRDGWLLAWALMHGVLLVIVPHWLTVAFLLWWNANTISHNFVHLPFFRARGLNRAFSIYLTLLLGLPQRLWAQRHLAHHTGRACVVRWDRQLRIECVVVAAEWTILFALAPHYGLGVWLPGWIAGLVLCQLHGYFEHSAGTRSHYGRWYNRVFFNDGYHVEHHRRPQVHWSRLPQEQTAPRSASSFPAVLRWFEWLNLDRLERLAIYCPPIRRFVLATHERALRQLLPQFRQARNVLIVGGGLFPRSALLLRKLIPEARITIIEAELDHLGLARRWLDDSVCLTHGWYDPNTPNTTDGIYDLVVVPLALRGDREQFYQQPPARWVLLHDWWWHRRAASAGISILLLKRLNLLLA